MIDPLSIGVSIEYIAEEDRKSKNPTVWIIGSLDSFTQSKLISTLVDISVEDGKPKLEKLAQDNHPDFVIVKYGLKGFKNFGDVVFKSEKVTLFGQELEEVSKDVLKVIPLSVIHELANVIWRGNKVSEELEKN